ncbi:hypothetical protein EYF80_031328 [Liparis tanakae]|uniref:Uncharacterized protein n=1 Tax=Liparis tanakae TaxID=230148 RepID=A0A4Z2GXQ0_9TELE|nr:hypothetical protein EYF80_031328 [Liparis tanakae]
MYQGVQGGGGDRGPIGQASPRPRALLWGLLLLPRLSTGQMGAEATGSGRRYRWPHSSLSPSGRSRWHKSRFGLAPLPSSPVSTGAQKGIDVHECGGAGAEPIGLLSSTTLPEKVRVSKHNVPRVAVGGKAHEAGHMLRKTRLLLHLGSPTLMEQSQKHDAQLPVLHNHEAERCSLAEGWRNCLDYTLIRISDPTWIRCRINTTATPDIPK